ncbi:hypothetical protein [Bradyrhizobium sp. dw_78]|uniref:hypothetical protein n=1 Tax=Bradyrhizobium sp. dw_78 TaxID=2719793 RepID=UPI001BD6AFDD|nr:hypothetical protein [Bradyrhizobium sp. dw_78]
MDRHAAEDFRHCRLNLPPSHRQISGSFAVKSSAIFGVERPLRHSSTSFRGAPLGASPESIGPHAQAAEWIPGSMLRITLEGR